MRRVRPWPAALAFLAAAVLRAAAPAPPAPTTEADDEKLLAAAKINVDGPGLLDYFRKLTAPPGRREQIQTLIRQLGDDSFKVRQKATADLAALGPAAAPLLRRALDDPDEEIKERAENLIRAAEGLDARAARSAAAARLLRRRAPADAAAVLLSFAPDAEIDEVEEEVVASLAVTAVHDGKVDPAVVAALKDGDVGRRCAAAVVVGRSGTKGQRAEVEALRTDPDPRLRFRAAQGLLAGRDPAAVPTLVALVKDGPAGLAFRANDLLSSAYGAHWKRTPFDEEAAARQACAKDWQEWTKAHPSPPLSPRAAADLPAFNPALQARDAARRFFNALTAGDLAAFQKAAGAPFHMTNEKTYEKPEDLATYFNGNSLGLRGGQYAMSLMGTVPLREYIDKSTDDAEKEFAGRFRARPDDVTVLHIRLNQAGAPPGPGMSQDVLFLVRLTGDRPRVIGVAGGRTQITSGWD